MEADEYRKLAEVEDRMWYFVALHGHLERSLNRVAPVAAERGGVGLDAGCGTGGFLRRIKTARPAWQWSGVDFSPLAVAAATERAGGPIVEASVESLPHADRSVDAVVSADVLYHVDDDGRALREFYRVLRPGGAVVINVPAYRWLWSYHDVAVHSRRRYGHSELVAKLVTAGFGDIETTFWNMLPLPLVVLRRKLLPAPRDASDVHVFPAPIEAGFRGLMAMERAWLRRGWRLPAGSSILAVARRSR
jgi:ubiquinone/menaquinone biosynthesis C-methylase UbiE